MYKDDIAGCKTALVSENDGDGTFIRKNE